MPSWKCFSCIRFPNEDNITILDYSNGTLTRVPPDVSQFERTLEELYLSSNRIRDLPPELFYCQGIRTLKLNDNELETIPYAIASLRQLQMLDLSRNALTYIPENIKSCKHLTHLDLSLNSLYRLPDAITSLISLQELFLNETCLEFLPANFGRLVNLKILELRSNFLSNLPKSMARLKELIRIDIGANEFTELPEVIGELTKLRELWIDLNQIRRISANISNLSELIHFEANGNQLTTLPNGISNWKNLEVLSLSTNNFWELPFSMGMLKKLVTLKCDTNRLRELPDSICHLENLEEMVINHNRITRLPSTIGLLRKLRFLSGDENHIIRLPDEICSCIALSVLSLSGNNLIELPRDMGHLINLRVLNIVNNCIISLPVSILNLDLTALWISDNQSQPQVRLQFVDSNTKKELTCFMLPQTAGIKTDQSTSNRIDEINTRPVSSSFSDSGSDGSPPNVIKRGSVQISQNAYNIDGLTSLQRQQTIEDEVSENTVPLSSPSRRICFADDAGVKANDPIRKRLMRSPTPYPKELRSMAKYLKGINQSNSLRGDEGVAMPQQQVEEVIDLSNFSTETEGIRIKEAKVLVNPGGGVGQIPISSSSSANCDSLSKSARHFYITSVGGGGGNGSGSGTGSNGARYQNLEDTISTSLTQNETYEIPLPQDIRLRTDYVDFGVKQIAPVSATYDLMKQPYIQAPFQIVQSTEYLPRQPPPYHVAKVFTKKSPADLLSYDTARNQTQLRNVSNESDSNSNLNFGGTENDLSSDIYLDMNRNNRQNGDFSDHSGRNSRNNNNNNIDEGDTMRFDESVNSGGDHQPSESSEQIADIEGEEFQQYQYEENSARNDSAKHPSKSQVIWLFGLHKNPTVKQIIVKKEDIPGFDIKEVPNQGIFVSIIIPNTPISSQLRVDDKILDIDGIDFAKIDLKEAYEVLRCSGPTLNIMISRK